VAVVFYKFLTRFVRLLKLNFRVADHTGSDWGSRVDLTFRFRRAKATAGRSVAALNRISVQRSKDDFSTASPRSSATLAATNAKTITITTAMTARGMICIGKNCQRNASATAHNAVAV
jgi:hypothetical protein